MKDITQLVDCTLQNLKKKNLLPTPENYEKEFFKLSKKSELLIEDLVEFDELKDSLSKKEISTFENEESQSFKELSKLLNQRLNADDVKNFLSDLSYFMSPSLSKELKDEIDNICEDIASNPNELINTSSRRKLRLLTDNRIKNDKTIFNEKNFDVKKLILFLGKFLKKTLNENSLTLEKIINIKDEINDIGLSKSSSKHLDLLHEKLLETIENFENIVINSNNSVIQTQKETESLYLEIEKLKENLDKAEEEKSIDFLTGVLTRRAYSFEITRIENEYKIYDSNYAIIFYDLDHFKKINDRYGHDCGDKVLETFALILSKLTRSKDIISRYGGEEFICVVHYKNTMEIHNYIRRVKNIVSNNKFICKDIKIEVEFSAGVALRSNYTSYEETLKKADVLLYEAKDNGRNKIILDGGDTF